MVEVTLRAPLQPRRQPLIQPSIQPDKLSPRAERQPIQVHADSSIPELVVLLDVLSAPSSVHGSSMKCGNYTRLVSFDRSITGGGEPAEPLGGAGGMREERPASHSTWLADGTLACPRCDAPVAPAQRVLSPAGPMDCGYCRYDGAVRDFLSLSAPTRPTRVAVHLRMAPRRRLRV